MIHHFKEKKANKFRELPFLLTMFSSCKIKELVFYFLKFTKNKKVDEVIIKYENDNLEWINLMPIIKSKYFWVLNSIRRYGCFSNIHQKIYTFRNISESLKNFKLIQHESILKQVILSKLSRTNLNFDNKITKNLLNEDLNFLFDYLEDLGENLIINNKFNLSKGYLEIKGNRQEIIKQINKNPWVKDIYLRNLYGNLK